MFIVFDNRSIKKTKRFLPEEQHVRGCPQKTSAQNREKLTPFSPCPHWTNSPPPLTADVFYRQLLKCFTWCW